ncbi:MAG TPA: metalloregulator ArsR/SmtB family transcription factor [Ktedonobacterales bacterium]
MTSERETLEPGETTPDERMERLLRALKTLADLSRLRILGAVATQERTVEELASLLDLKAPTVSHHLARLRDLGLIQTRADGVTRWNGLSVTGLEALAKLLSAPEVVATAAADVEGVAWERKVLRDFLDESDPPRLREIPAQRKKRRVILRWLADQFEWDHDYSEKEVNSMLKRRHEDTATLRRELIGERLLARDSGRYWRSEPPSEEALARVLRRLEWGRIYTLAELTAQIHEVARDADTVRGELLARGALSFSGDRERYWLARPPEERLR